ncbi:MAG: hypothetical protein GXO09_01295, partial [Crenarchaeota archaeon]|nr:hypothetical protein [Thermoproteota archaeon]
MAGPPEAVEDGRWVVAIVSAADEEAMAEAMRVCHSIRGLICISGGPDIAHELGEKYVYVVGGIVLGGGSVSAELLLAYARLAQILRVDGETVRAAARRLNELAAAYGGSVVQERRVELLVRMYEEGLLEDPLRPLCPLTGMECPCESCIAVLRSEGVTPCGVVAL